MKPVVSNTTPLRYLIEIDAIHVLPFLFEKIVVPPVVIQELSHPRTPKKVREFMTSLPKWIETRSVSIEDPTLDILDPGERDAILLAESLQAAGILLDEKFAREIAEQRRNCSLTENSQGTGKGSINRRIGTTALSGRVLIFRESSCSRQIKQMGFCRKTRKGRHSSPLYTQAHFHLKPDLYQRILNQVGESV